jgi:hypothetical protein
MRTHCPVHAPAASDFTATERHALRAADLFGYVSRRGSADSGESDYVIL